MKKRVLSAFMALALCLTLLPTAALADEGGETAETPITVGTGKYATLGAAFDAASNGDTVRLNANVTLTGHVRLKNKSVTLDLNGYVLSSEDYSLVVESGASLTVTNADAKNNTHIGTDAGLNLSLFAQQGSKFTCTGGKIAALALQTADLSLIHI